MRLRAMALACAAGITAAGISARHKPSQRVNERSFDDAGDTMPAT